MLASDSESARVILRNKLPGHKPAAVEVFDLDEEGDWARKLTEPQWKIAISRLRASDREEQLFAQFVRERLSATSAAR